MFPWLCPQSVPLLSTLHPGPGGVPHITRLCQVLPTPCCSVDSFVSQNTGSSFGKTACAFQTCFNELENGSMLWSRCSSWPLYHLQDNYTFAQPGIQKKVKALEELVSRIDGRLGKGELSGSSTV